MEAAGQRERRQGTGSLGTTVGVRGGHVCVWGPPGKEVEYSAQARWAQQWAGIAENPRTPRAVQTRRSPVRMYWATYEGLH